MKRSSQRALAGAAVVSFLCAACNNEGDGIDQLIEITSVAPPSASAGEPFQYQVTVDEEEGAVSFAIDTGPTGMTITTNGLVEWTPTVADVGTANVTVSATDATSSATQSFALDVDQGLLLGVGISPKGHTDSSTNDDFVEQYTTPDETGRVIGFFDPWRLDVSADGELTALTDAAFADAESFGFVPLVVLKWADGSGEPDLTSESDGADNSWTNAETRAEFLSVVTEIATKWRPPYLGLGHETNLYWGTHQAEWAAWISEFEECYDAIKAASPDTMVFTVFQWEVMKNLGVGTIGFDFGQHFQLIDDHVASGKIDAIAFTSFPYFEHATAAGVPDGYYDEIAAHWDGPVLFPEIAWPASPHAPFPGSEQDQVAFIGRFFELASGLDLEHVGWAFQHDWDGEDTQPAFAGIGLRSNDGTEIRPADDAWQAAIALRERPQ